MYVCMCARERGVNRLPYTRRVAYLRMYCVEHTGGEWQPNLNLFTWGVGMWPDRLSNIYFTYVFLLRAAHKIEYALMVGVVQVVHFVRDVLCVVNVHHMCVGVQCVECVHVCMCG
jgi:Endoplasmic Reticulum Oxidoreductin 1 (ERO1)